MHSIYCTIPDSACSFPPLLTGYCLDPRYSALVSSPLGHHWPQHFQQIQPSKHSYNITTHYWEHGIALYWWRDRWRRKPWGWVLRSRQGAAVRYQHQQHLYHLRCSLLLLLLLLLLSAAFLPPTIRSKICTPQQQDIDAFASVGVMLGWGLGLPPLYKDETFTLYILQSAL